MAIVDTQFWPWSSWKICLSRGDDGNLVEPNLPFAFIGSHESCAVKIEDLRVPPIVYLACCFPDSIEVWPLCAIAFARWGPIRSIEELVVGKTVLTFSHAGFGGQLTNRNFHRQPGLPLVRPDSDAASPNTNATSTISRNPYLALHCVDKFRSKELRRRVTIMGGGHPSTLRLRGHGLAMCDHAIISFEGRVWLIDLKPRRDSASADWVRELSAGSPPKGIGSMRVSLGEESVRKDSYLATLPDKAFKSIVDSPLHAALRDEAVGTRLASNAVAYNGLACIDATANGEERLGSAITDRQVAMLRLKLLRTKIWVSGALFASLIVVALVGLGVMLSRNREEINTDTSEMRAILSRSVEE